jgi:hypothetical protein
MTAQFGPFTFGLYPKVRFMMRTAKKYKLSPEKTRHMRKPKMDETLYRIEYLDWVFRPDQLPWLARMPKRSSHPPSLAYGAVLLTACTRADMAKLESFIGFPLPSAFTTLFTTQDLLDRLPAFVASYLHLKMRVRNVESGVAPGYLISIFDIRNHEFRDDAHWAMYVSPDGPHCVLDTETDSDITDDCPVRSQGVGFAEWLLMLCYSKSAYQASKFNGEVSADLEEYVRVLYVSGSRAE